ncbi:ArgS-related anticodon-binding protein NrtL [Streptomyces sp. NPDC047706]|uniref:ArgS-related anticodon-binding protein NrtL n=1 Tax=Streptomyces sp. NPDC047706 TaxID=3365486 RepID=UPI003713FCA8
MTPVELSRTVLHAVRRAVDQGELTAVVPTRAVVTPPGPGGWGDYATNIALQLARSAGQPPLRVAEVLRTYISGTEGIRGVEITGPGFLNIALEGAAAVDVVQRILRGGDRYGHSDALAGQVVRLHAPQEVRALVVLDASARILRTQGALVRTSCGARPEPEWEAVLGVHVDACGTDACGTDASPGRRAGNAVHVDTYGTDTPPGESAPVVIRPTASPADPAPLGRDAARWALLHPAAHDRPRINPGHLVQRESNPLFRVRYAHARTRALVRNAADLGFSAEPGHLGGAGAFPTLPTLPTLVTLLADHPRILAAAATQHAPDRLARHLVSVADAVLPLLHSVLPRGAEKPSAAHRARLALAEAAGTVLAGGLSLLGVDAPEHL